ncbi:hypothetical protein V2G26_000279 [Clonostachys chloroleuca]|uniref:NWD NACHT-NTPase N-terminal domain-containing protein n=1 Tax=Clonostachys chloroleuca TaxID=1926264 RepID=A0AA35QFW9_9HYPO|nr:unnamed protein product [Clonostachys chloroleuca]
MTAAMRDETRVEISTQHSPGILKRLVHRVRNNSSSDSSGSGSSSSSNDYAARKPSTSPVRRGTVDSDDSQCDPKCKRLTPSPHSKPKPQQKPSKPQKQHYQPTTAIPYSRSGYAPAPKKKSVSSASSGHSAEIALSRELWDEAYDALRLDPSTKSLVVTYEAIISQELSDDLKLATRSTLSPPEGDTNRRMELMSAITRAGLSKRKGSKPSQADDVPKILLDSTRRTVETAWDEYPSAALAWSGLSILTPLLIDPILRHDEFRKGMVHVIGRIHWYMHLTYLLQCPSWHDAEDLAARQDELAARRTRARDEVLRLYRRVLEFEMNCVCASASAWNSAARHMVRWNSLDKLNESIVEADGKVRRLVEELVVEGAMRTRMLAWEADLDLDALVVKTAMQEEERRMMEERRGEEQPKDA